MEKTLTVTPCTLEQVLPWLVQATRPKADTTGGLATVQDLCRNAQAMRVEYEGQTVGAYAVEPVEFDRGVMLWIVAAGANVDGVDMTETLTKVIETQARKIGASRVGLITKRPGLIKKLKAMGYTVNGVSLGKKL